MSTTRSPSAASPGVCPVRPWKNVKYARDSSADTSGGTCTTRRIPPTTLRRIPSISVATNRRQKPAARATRSWRASTGRHASSGTLRPMTERSELDPGTEERIEQPASEEAEREARLTPAQAVARMRIRVPERGNRKLRRLIERVNDDDQLKAWWHVANVNAVTRMEINDHSWVHIQIVTNIALKLLRQLTKHGVEPAMVTDYGMTRGDAEVVVVLTALTHCVGMSVHRKGHEDFSLFLSEPKLRELLTGIYEEPELTVVVSEVLQGIISHRADGEPLTLEAGILRVADALDMEQGRSRIAFERGRIGIHSLS